MNTIRGIRHHLARLPEGQPLLTKDVLGYGSRASVDQALSRLVRRGELARVARGIYMRPKHSPYAGLVPPEPLKVARALAAQTGSKIQVHGAEAARRMGLSTQVPSRPIYYTSGPSRHVRLGQIEVTLKHVTPRRLAMADRPAGIALTALWYLGKTQATNDAIGIIRQHLPRDEFEALCSSPQIMPGWMYAALLRFKEDERLA